MIPLKLTIYILLVIWMILTEVISEYLENMMFLRFTKKLIDGYSCHRHSVSDDITHIGKSND